MYQPSNHLQQFELAVHLLQKTNKICILTGAGVSAESGIPTFRDEKTGLWKNYRAEQLANIDDFNHNPKFVWSWYQWRRNLVKDKLPNPAHHALTKWIKMSTDKEVGLITQNVDDLHEQAGSTPVHLHGNLWKNKCSNCQKPYQLEKNSRYYDIQDDYNAADLVECLACPSCNGYIPPDIVWFGEKLPEKVWQTAEDLAMSCEVFISIGTSSVVYLAAGLASLAKQQGATIIEINPNLIDNSVVDICLAKKAGDILPTLVDKVLEMKI